MLAERMPDGGGGALWPHPTTGDPLVACLSFVATRFERPAAPAVIVAGLALDDDGRLPFHQAAAAIERLGMHAERLTRPLARWPASACPAIVDLGDGAAVVLSMIGDDVEAYFPGDAAPRWVAREALSARMSGVALHVIPDLAVEQGSALSPRERARHHWFWREVLDARASLGWVIAAAALINVLAFALPLFTMNVYDRIIPNKAAATLWVLAFGVALAFAMDFALKLARARLIDEMGREIDARLSQKLFEKVVNLPLGARQGSTGALARRVSDFEQVREFFTSTTVVLIVDMAFLFAFVALITLLGGWLAVIPVVAIAVMLFAGFAIQRAMRGVVLEAQADTSLQNTVLVEVIGALETVKACRAEGRMLGRWRRYAQAGATIQERLRRLTALSVNLASLCQQVTSISLVIGGFYLFDAGHITMGAIIAIVMLAGRSLAPVSQFAFLMTRARQAMTTLDTLQGLMDQGDERSIVGRSSIPEIGRGGVVVDALDFTYPGAMRPSLKGISLKIEPGERIAIIGRVASGKSTLGRLLCGLYPPTAGGIAIDGLDSRQYHPHDLRSQFRFVAQDAELFSGTVRDNLLAGAQSAGEDSIFPALERSGADRFFGRDAAGIDMHVGERGNRLSGGQRSFLLFARALMTPSRLLFLDEPTGAMDTQSETTFVDSLRSALAPGQTLIVSTHRHAMLSIVDRLIVIDQGTIIADGPRDEILGRLADKVAKS